MTLADAGKLHISVAWDGAAVTAVDIRSSRPQAARLLAGRTPEQAVQLAPLLFGICGRAQGAAAAAAVAAAQRQDLPQLAPLQRAVAGEALQEHLWRLLLDWPQMLDLSPVQAEFVRWHGQLREVAAGHGDLATLLTEMERAWLGLPVAEWLALSSYRELQDWWQASAAPAARLLAALDAVDAQAGDVDGVNWLPPLTARQALAAGAGDWDAAFAARPQWQGRPAETGALACHAQAPLLRDVLRQRPNGLLARVLARAYDMLLMASGGADRMDSANTGDDDGLAVVRTARGLLLHHVRLAAGRVQDYLIVAPTEWNFHPQGALAAGLAGCAANDAVQLEQTVRRWVLALDPCVEYGIEIIVSAPHYA